MRKILPVGCLRIHVRNKGGSMREVRFGLGHRVSLLFTVYVDKMARSLQDQRQMLKSSPVPGRESKVLPLRKSLSQGAQCRLHRKAWTGELRGDPVTLPGSGTKGCPRYRVGTHRLSVLPHLTHSLKKWQMWDTFS